MPWTKEELAEICGLLTDDDGETLDNEKSTMKTNALDNLKTKSSNYDDEYFSNVKYKSNDYKKNHSRILS